MKAEKDLSKIIEIKEKKEKAKDPYSIRVTVLLVIVASIMVAMVYMICAGIVLVNLPDDYKESYEITISVEDKIYVEWDNILYINNNGKKELNYPLMFKVLFLLLSGFAVFMIMYYKLMDKTSRQIKQMKQSLDFIAEGEFDFVIDDSGDNEIAWIARNINDLSKRVERLIEAEREIEKTKNELVVSIAHDLRTPMTSIKGYLDLINNKELDEEARKKYTQIAYEKTLRLETLVEDLFTYTKFSLGQYSTNFTQLNIMRLLEQLVDEFYPQFMENELECDFLAENGDYLINADGELLARLFANLLSNSVKYGKDGKRITVEALANEKYVEIKVINYGKVIPKKDLERIFDKFYRLENSRNASTGGTGLGLAIVKQITDIHNGRITVTSDINGTIFTVRIPKEESDV